MTSLNTRLIPMDVGDSNQKKFLKRSLKVATLIIATFGLAILLYSAWMFLTCLRDNRKYLFASWFLWTCTGTGIMFCFTAFIGYVAAATRKGIFLSCYLVFIFLLLLEEILVTADVLLNDDWDKDFPKDPTRRFDAFVDYVDSHSFIFDFLGLWFLFAQVTSFILAMVLRTKYSKLQRYRNNHDEQVSASIPFLNHHIVPLPYVVGHPHPAPENVADFAVKDKDSMPFSEPEIWSMARNGCPPY